MIDLPMLTDLVLVVTLWATSIGVGAVLPLGVVRWREDRTWMARGVLLNLLAVPLVAAILCALIPVSGDARIGLILISVAAGGLLGLTTTRVAGGDVRQALLLVLVLEIADVVAIPIWSSLLLSASTAPPLVPVARTLLLMLVLPLVVGLLIRRVGPQLVPSVARACGLASAVGLVIVVILVLVDAAPVIPIVLGSGVPIIALGLVGGGIVAGMLAGGPTLAGRRALAMVTAGHASALALALARSAFPDRPDVEATVVVAGLIGIALPVAVAMGIRARDARAPAR